VTGLFCYKPERRFRFRGGLFLGAKRLSGHLGCRSRLLTTSGATVWTVCTSGNTGSAAGSFIRTDARPSGWFGCSRGVTGAKCPYTDLRTGSG
jgi:hypothetical protein